MTCMQITKFFVFIYEKLKLKQVLQPPIIASVSLIYLPNNLVTVFIKEFYQLDSYDEHILTSMNNFAADPGHGTWSDTIFKEIDLYI